MQPQGTRNPSLTPQSRLRRVVLPLAGGAPADPLVPPANGKAGELGRPTVLLAAGRLLRRSSFVGDVAS